ncbi:hypothetical protein PHLGIDRAFT_237431 [Phlebiopsis gigantea 11061_1 CR5-6]|uniref:Uncharacterized protein n=1 Tax=Phlebiopsis gigantea (strain 11061_1 CR5-6) TaxID=745531 RepID=A0A0C3RSR7_PHLG1|nr:hypothetical protein PHLGIDRAFT_237431 [Phlebiopsis gigantea 11061_1 CR5-6]
MATPSSSTTTPSPRPQFLQASALPPSTPSIASRNGDDPSLEERKRAVQKFFANAQIAQLARGLRTRLTYATFKATHNLAHNTINDLEVQTQAQSARPRSPIARQSGHHYNNLASQGSNATGAGTSSRGLTRKGTMPPPPPVTASATQSLFSSLLQPPPSKRARTIHNPQDPPIPPPTKPRPVTPPRKSAKTPRGPPSSQSKAKARKDVKGKKRETASGSRIVTPQSTLGSEDFVDNDDDMKAAATLTSLLHSRPSMSVTASSPRSSMSAGSEGGSNHSYSHYAQSSTRTTAPVASTPSNGALLTPRFTRSTTPPSSSRHIRTQSLPHVGSTTPKAPAPITDNKNSTIVTPHPPSDTEAADLMLFLATSPSPVRPTNAKERDAKDMAAFRSLSGSSSLKGRVLFSGPPQGSDDRSATTGKTLRREAGSTASSVSSIGGDALGGPSAMPSSPLNPHVRAARGDQATNDPTDPRSRRQQALPAPTSPTRTRPLERSASVPVSSESRAAAASSPMGSFNLHEYLNVSPSPAASGSSSKLSSLRANVGRKLFEEHHGLGGGAAGRENVASPAGGLGAGIDLIKSSV